jgi:hypothetical protein
LGQALAASEIEAIARLDRGDTLRILTHTTNPQRSPSFMLNRGKLMLRLNRMTACGKSASLTGREGARSISFANFMLRKDGGATRRSHTRRVEK